VTQSDAKPQHISALLKKFNKVTRIITIVILVSKYRVSSNEHNEPCQSCQPPQSPQSQSQLSPSNGGQERRRPKAHTQASDPPSGACVMRLFFSIRALTRRSCRPLKNAYTFTHLHTEAAKASFTSARTGLLANHIPLSLAPGQRCSNRKEKRAC